MFAVELATLGRFVQGSALAFDLRLSVCCNGIGAIPSLAAVCTAILCERPVTCKSVGVSGLSALHVLPHVTEQVGLRCVEKVIVRPFCTLIISSISCMQSRLPARSSCSKYGKLLHALGIAT